MSGTVASTLRAQGAALDAAAQTVPGERHLKPVRDEGASEPKTLGLVWVVTSYPLVAAGLERVLEGKADVRIGVNSFAGSPSCVVLYAEGMKEGFADGMRHIHELYPGVPLLAFGPRLDLALALTLLKNGANGYVHAAMECEQVLKAVEVVEKGELAAPRQLLPHLLSQDASPEVGDLTVRQREVLDIVAEGASNAEIARRLYLSESTIKQHLRSAYKVLGVRTRSEAAALMNKHARAF